MASLLTLVKSQPPRSLKPGEALVTVGETSGELYVLESGRLTVEREGFAIATISEPGALIGEMSALLGIDHSATVRAETATTVRVVDNAIAFLERTPLVALQVATLACERLNATSALLVELRRQEAGKAEHGLLSRILSSLTTPPKAGAVLPHE